MHLIVIPSPPNGGKTTLMMWIAEQICKDIDEDIILYEGIEIEKHYVHEGSDFIGRSVAELDIKHSVGCIIIGIERDSEVITDIVPSIMIKSGDVVAVVGSRDQISAFKEHYVK